MSDSEESEVLDVHRKAFCIRCDGGKQIAWSANESFSVSGYKRLSDREIQVIASGKHHLRIDLHEADDKPHLSLRGLALQSTKEAIFRWSKDGLRLEQHQYALEHEIMSLRTSLREAHYEYGFVSNNYNEDKMDARQRTVAMKEQAKWQREISNLSTKLRGKQLMYQRVLTDQLYNLTLRRVRESIDESMRPAFEQYLRQSLNGKFCDALFRFMWTSSSLEHLEFKHMRLTKVESGIVAWLLNNWRTKVGL